MELHLGFWSKAELLTEFLWNRDLTMLANSHRYKYDSKFIIRSA